MKKIISRALMILTVVLASIAGRTAPVLADAGGGPNYDAVFVIDASGSMKYSDEKKLRFSAGQLFTDLVASGTARAGFAQFTNIIMDEKELTDLSDRGQKDAFRDRIANLADAEKPNDDTDIALGLEKGLQILKNAGSVDDETRNPMLLLISDGNTDFSDTTSNAADNEAKIEESNALLEEVLDEAVQLGVKIYAVGLNDDGKLDEENLNRITEVTGGRAYIIETALEFIKCMEDIFVDTEGDESEEQDVQLKEQRYEADIDIPNSSILTAKINIIAGNGVKDIKLFNPDGNEEPLDNNDRIQVSREILPTGDAPRYSMISIYYPRRGLWKISVEAEEDASSDPEAIKKAIQISMITSYDLSFGMDETKEKYLGEPVEIVGRVYQEEEPVEDEYLLGESEAVYTVFDEENNKAASGNVPYDKEAGCYKIDLEPEIFTDFGEYRIEAAVNGKDGVFTIDPAEQKFNILRVPISIKENMENVQIEDMWFGPFVRDGAFDLMEHVENVKSSSELTCRTEEDAPADIQYDSETGTVTVTPLKTGDISFPVYAENEYGDSLALNINASVKPSVLWILIPAAVLLLILLVLYIVHLMLRPSLKYPVILGMDLPYELRNLTPPETKIAMPGKKTHKVNLLKLIMSDQFTARNLGEAISRSGAGALLGKITLEAAGKDKVAVKIPPKVEGMIIVDNQTIDSKKGYTVRLTNGNKITIQYSANGQQTTNISMAIGESSPFGGNQSNPFGGNQSNPFGGNQSNPFGGNQSNPFGGSQSNPFGGNQNPFGGSQNNPFGGGQNKPFGGSQNNPFGGGQSNSFGSGQGNPFGGGQSNSFGSGQGNPSGDSQNNPFGGDRNQSGNGSSSFGSGNYGSFGTPGGQQNPSSDSLGSGSGSEFDFGGGTGGDDGF